MATSSSYPARFGGPGRAAFVAAVTPSSGKMAWSRDIGFALESARPDVLTWGTSVLVVGHRQMALFDADGHRRWTRDKRAGSPVAINNGRLYFENRGRFLDAVDIDNQLVIDSAPLAGVTGQGWQVSQLWPQRDDFIVTLTNPDPVYDEEDETRPHPQPSVVGHRVAYGQRLGDWGQRYAGVQALPALFVPELGRWLAALPAVVSVDVRQGDESPRFRLPLDKLVDWSADAAGRLVVSGYLQGAKALLALAIDGRELWRWVDRDGGDGWAARQPPLQAGTRAYALTDGRLLAFDAGKLLWQCDLRSAGLHHGATVGDGSFEVRDGRLLSTAKLAYATALADNTVLVVGDRTLHAVAADGSLRFGITLDAPLQAPAVVDASGNVFVLTATQLVKLR